MITHPTRAQLAAVLAGSGAIGFFLGLVRYPAWPDALEPAQVLAGLVTYPPDNPVYLYSTRTWTVLHEGLAVLLSLGFSELTLALVVSGLTGMLSLQALGVIILAVGGDVGLAVLAPFFIQVTHGASGGVSYPVALMGVQPTYGVVGLSYVLLAMALMGVGRVRAAALMLGFAPAVHVTIGLWTIVIATAALAMDRTRAATIARAAWRWLLAGALVAAMLAVVHYVGWVPGDAAAPATAVTGAWGNHRQPFPLFSSRALATWFSAALPALWLWRYGRDIPERARTLMAILVTAAAAGATLSVVYWLPPSSISNAVATLMPSRLLNLPVIAAMALIVGLLARYRQTFLSAAVLPSLTAVLLAINATIGQYDVDGLRMALAWVAMCLAASVLVFVAERRRRGAASVADSADPTLTAWMRRATVAILTGALAAAIIVSVRDFAEQSVGMAPERSNDPFFAIAAGRRGMLLTGSDLHLMQLKTRRPVLLDGGALDGLHYAPAAAAETDRILRRVYGTNLQSIQQAHLGALDSEAGKTLWEAREPDEWQRIAREFGITDIVVYRSWQLKLPLVASDPDFALYTATPGTPAELSVP